MKKKFVVRKFLSLALSLAMVLGSMTLPVRAAGESDGQGNNDNTPETIKMPVTIYDHLNDGLLFEYDLAEILNQTETEGEGLPYPNLSLNSDDTKASEGLVAETLDEKTKKPVYTKKTVEQAAKLVQLYLQKDPTVNITGTDPNKENEVFKQIKNKLLTKGSKEEISLTSTDDIQSKVNNINLTDLGWNLGADLIYVNNEWKDSKGNVVWKHEGGDQLVCAGPALSTAVYTCEGLQAGTYTLDYSEAYTTIDKFNAYIDVNGQEIPISNQGTTFQVPNDDSKIKVVLIRNTEPADHPEITKPTIKNSEGEEIIKEFTKITDDDKDQYKSKLLEQAFLNMGFSKTEGSTWRICDYGDGITCNLTSKADKEISAKGYAWIEKVVKKSVKYTLEYQNEEDLCKVQVVDENNQEIPGCIKENGKIEFTSPNDGKIRILISQNESKIDTPGYRKISGVSLTSSNHVSLGNYEESKEKYTKEDNEPAKGLNDIATCMDYAYYVLNNFWSSTSNDDITKKSNAYKTITLQRVSGSDNYTIDASNLVYDVDNNNIYQDNKNVNNNSFFPLDKAVFEDKNTEYDGYPDEYELPGPDTNPADHNYHFAMKAHTQFIYNSKDNLQFTFKGDDDVYLFVNGHLVLDLGGAHHPIGKTVDINEEIEEGALRGTGITDGDICTMEFFYLERHSSASNLQITTNIKFLQPESTSSVKFTKATENGEEEIDNNTDLHLNDKIGIHYSVTAGNDEMTNVKFEDSALSVTIDEAGIKLGDKGIVVGDEGLTLEIKDKDGNVIQGKTRKISKDDISDENKWKEFLYGTKGNPVSIDKDQTISISGLYRTIDKNFMESLLKSEKLFTSNLSTDLDVTLQDYNDETGNYEPKEQVATSDDVKYLIPQNTPTATLGVTLTAKDKDGKEVLTSDTIPEGSRVYVNYTLTATSNWMKGVSITDKGTGIEINKDGIKIPEGYEIDDEITIQGPGNKWIKITKDDLKEENAKKLQDKLKVFDKDAQTAWELNDNETITISGIYTTLTKNIEKVESNVTAAFNGPNPTYNEETKEFSVPYASAENLKANATITKETTYDVKFEIDADDPVKGSLDGDTTDRVVKGGNTDKKPTVKPKTGYKFSYWIINGDENNTTTTPKEVTINGDTTFTAVFDPIECSYTIKYVEKIGDEEKDIPDKDPLTLYGLFDQTITLKDLKPEYYEIEGYNRVGDPAPLRISSDETKNVITLVYLRKEYNVTFDTDGHGNLNNDGKNQTVKHLGTVTKVPTNTPNPGYEFTCWEYNNGEQSGTTTNPSDVQITKDTTFTAQFVPKEYSYIVQYVDESGNPVAPQRVIDKKVYGDTITEKPIEVEGYTTKDTEKTIPIVEDTPLKTTITFTYTKNKYTVTFDTDGHGTLDDKEDPIQKTVAYNDAVQIVPEQTPKDGYQFIGWIDVANPSKTFTKEDLAKEPITDNRTFTATYEALPGTIVVKLSENAPFDDTETVTVFIKDKDGNVKRSGELSKGDNEKTFDNLPVGIYTVTTADGTKYTYTVADDQGKTDDGIIELGAGKTQTAEIGAKLNPGTITVKLDESVSWNDKGSVKVTIKDENGNTVKEGTLSKDKKEITYKNLPAGTYTVEADGDKYTFTVTDDEKSTEDGTIKLENGKSQVATIHVKDTSDPTDPSNPGSSDDDNQGTDDDGNQGTDDNGNGQGAGSNGSGSTGSNGSGSASGSTSSSNSNNSSYNSGKGPSTSSVKTGDTSNMALYGGVCGVAFLTMIALFVFRKKRN